MKKIKYYLTTLLSIGFVSLIVVSCGAKKSDGFEEKISTDLISAGRDGKGTGAAITFDQTVYDFGVIKEGTVINFAFKFKNTGTTDLIIGDARGNCGCTVPKYPTHPISPGDEAQIDVTFNSDGKHGKQHKSVTLVTNATPSTQVLAVNGEVLPATQMK